MNARQLLILKWCIAVVVAMLVFPPLVIYGQGGMHRNMGYGFLLSQNDGAVVNIGLLFAQWFLVAAVSAVLIYTNSRWTGDSKDTVPLLQRASSALADAWTRSKFWRYVFLAMMAVDLLFVASNSGGSGAAAITPLIRAIGWAMLLILNFAYHVVRSFFGMPAHQSGPRFSVKRILTTVAVVVIFLAGLFLLNPKPSTGKFVFDDEKGTEPWLRDWSRSKK